MKTLKSIKTYDEDLEVRRGTWVNSRRACIIIEVRVSVLHFSKARVTFVDKDKARECTLEVCLVHNII